MVEELKVIISAEIGELKKELKQGQKEVENVAKTAKETDGKFGKAMASIGKAAATAMKAVATAVIAGVTALVGLAEATSEYRTEQAKLNAAFESAGSSAEQASKTYNELYRVLGESDTAVEAANHLAKLTTNEKELSEWTTICQGVYATFGDSIPIEGLTEAANETAKVGQVTGTLADALNWAGVSEDAFNEKLEACNDEAEREALIRETLNGIYSEAAANYEKNAADVLAQNEAHIKLSDALAAVGKVLQPLVTDLTIFAAEALAKVMPYIQDLGNILLPLVQKGFTLLGQGVQLAIDTFSGLKDRVAEFSSKIQEANEWCKEHKTLLTMIGVAAGTVTAAIVAYNVAQAVKNAGGIVELAQLALLQVELWGLSAAQAAQTAATTIATTATAAFGAVMNFVTSPITLVVLAIGALIAIIVLCVKHWDEIKAKVLEVWENIKTAVTNGVQHVKDKFGEMKDRISEKAEEIKANVKEKFEAVKETMRTVMEAARATVNEKLTNIKNAYNEHGGGIKGIAAGFIEAVKGYYTAGYTFIDNLTGGKLSSIASTIKGKLNEAKNTVSTILGNIKDKFNSIFENAKTIVSNAINKIKSIMNFQWSLPKLKLPRISISGKFSLSPLEVPKFSITWNKLGGVFDNPTIFGFGNSLQGLGEDGAEAVVPLEKNTAWMNVLATKLSERMSAQNTPIVLQVDGKTFAQTSINTINQLTRQTGSLGLALI